LVIILVLVFPVHTLRASGNSEKRRGTSAQTEEKEEFPQWVRDLRRADIITFGSFPFTFFLSGIIVDVFRASQHNWDSRYAPWPVNMGGSVSRTAGENIATLSIAAGGAVLVAVADHIIQRVKRERAARYAAQLAPPDSIIIRSPWTPGEEEPESPSEAESGPSGETPPGDSPPGEAP
jgi:ABC-type Fe3+ transport system permease subunit